MISIFFNMKEFILEIILNLKINIRNWNLNKEALWLYRTVSSNSHSQTVFWQTLLIHACETFLRAFANRIFNKSLNILFFIGTTLCLALLLHPSSLNLLSSLHLLTCFLSRCYLGLTSLIYYIFMGNVCFSECFLLRFICVVKEDFWVPVYKDIRNTS